MKFFTKIFLILITVSFGVALFGKTVSAAILYMNPLEQVVSAEETLLVDIYLDSEKEIINAAQAQILYPQNLLEIVDISYGDSFLTLWPEEPTVDPTSGILGFVGGVPGGSYVFDAKVLTITFKANHTGTATVRFLEDKTSVHLNDGKGTPTKLSATEAKVTIKTPSSQEINISSPTHPDQDKWYSANDFIVQWEPRVDAFYSYMLSIDPQAEPDTIQEEEIGNVTFHDLADGIHYFMLYEKPSGESWTYAGRRRVKIDQTPPLPFEIELADSAKEFKENKAIIFSTTDAMSGINYYDVLQGDELFTNIVSPYSYQIKKSTYFLVRAHDKAGNITEAGKLIVPENKKIFSNFGIMIVIIIILLIIAIIIILRSRSKNEEEPHSE
ncbi:cohesin domain-containing protein [Patescibacteria group bacterium]|nr:cohesin domain-containing protein [Patescibacteria group bacterium]MBU1952239.1 cohesin domain-containing protein [Patescibacteria group bacterium]